MLSNDLTTLPALITSPGVEVAVFGGEDVVIVAGGDHRHLQIRLLDPLKQ